MFVGDTAVLLPPLVALTWNPTCPHPRVCPAQVTLMIPWLAKSDQAKVFPNNTTFDTPEQQEEVRGGSSAGGSRGGRERQPASMRSADFDAGHVPLSLLRCLLMPNTILSRCCADTTRRLCLPLSSLQYVRDWVKKRTGFESDFKVRLRMWLVCFGGAGNVALPAPAPVPRDAPSPCPTPTLPHPVAHPFSRPSRPSVDNRSPSTLAATPPRSAASFRWATPRSMCPITR